MCTTSVVYLIVVARARAHCKYIVVPSASAVYGCARGRGLKFRARFACTYSLLSMPPTLIWLPTPMYLHACLLAQGSSLFKLVEITMATVDSQVLQATSAISSWAECSNKNDRAID